MNNVWRLGNLPFVINVNSRPTNSPLPDSLPFSVTYDETTGLLRQVRDSSIHNMLERAYQNGSMLTGFMTESGLGSKYADDFLNFLIKYLTIEKLKHCKILEIGCGTGYLLSRLREVGAKVLGIEPGSQGAEGENKYGLVILNDFFPLNRLYDFAPFDLVIHHAFLEHVEDVNVILGKQKEILFPEGMVVLSIPDCEPYMDCGDISMFIHEHYSYFTERTLELSLLFNGFEPIVLRKASFGGSLYCIAKQFASPKQFFNGRVNSESQTQFSEFVNRSECNIQRFKNTVTDWQEKDGTVGIYCPARALNALFKCEITDNIRFFDDNILLQKKYYPGFAIPIESYEDLKKSPVKNVLITSYSFFDPIADKLNVVKGVQTHSLKDMFQIRGG